MNENQNTPDASGPAPAVARAPKSTAKEIERRIEQVAAWLVQGLGRSEIHRRAAEQWGISSRQTETYTSRVRERAREETGESRESLVSIELLRLDKLQTEIWDRAIAGDGRCIDRVLKIMERRARLLGLDSPYRAELSGSDGGPIGVTAVEIIHSPIDPHEVTGPPLQLRVTPGELPKPKAPATLSCRVV